MPSKRNATGNVTAQEAQRLRTMLQGRGATPGQVDDLVRGVVGNKSRREFVDTLREWLRTRPKADA